MTERGHSPVAGLLGDRLLVVLDEASWRAFRERLDRSATTVSGLRELLATPTVLEPGKRPM
ncbi:hypothetical protein [Asanoa iriomotensis]|uniref:hypothetical protein n=1 Tax=Asanoa iriomotensis TaxID=234613 RepID=UPI0019429493|nr:hypothetical protein [Asanoa iriomotensis]